MNIPAIHLLVEFVILLSLLLCTGLHVLEHLGDPLDGGHFAGHDSCRGHEKDGESQHFGQALSGKLPQQRRDCGEGAEKETGKHYRECCECSKTL